LGMLAPLAVNAVGDGTSRELAIPFVVWRACPVELCRVMEPYGRINPKVRKALGGRQREYLTIQPVRV
jgi:hypothetical protein